MKDAVERGAIPDLLGPINEGTNFIAPVILSDIPAGSKILEEEIFGPVLPVLTFTSREEVIREINKKPKPLALYIFSQRKAFREYILQIPLPAGYASMNACCSSPHPNLPFGGVNNSGIGKSHGYFGFMAFSQRKADTRQKNGWSAPYLPSPSLYKRDEKDR
ncbi:MAG: aldehyde dehydrogenase family protein [Bacteroidota bacterium]